MGAAYLTAVFGRGVTYTVVGATEFVLARLTDVGVGAVADVGEVALAVLVLGAGAGAGVALLVAGAGADS
jgi:hypothetical protein